MDFLGRHDLWHRALDVQIRSLGGAPYGTLPLGDGVWTPGGLLWQVPEEIEGRLRFYPGPEWHAAHQARHDDSASALVISGSPDFASYELEDADEFATWAFLHAQEHIRLRQAAGI